MRNPDDSALSTGSPSTVQGELSCVEGWAGRVRGQVPLPAHSHHIPDGVWGCLLQPYKPRAHNAHLNGENNCCSLPWSYQALQDMKGSSTTFCISSTSNQSNPQRIRQLQSELTVLTGMTLLIFQAFCSSFQTSPPWLLNIIDSQHNGKILTKLQCFTMAQKQLKISNNMLLRGLGLIAERSRVLAAITL